MPTYQYLCTSCGQRLEVRQSFTDEALTVCPECTGRLRKVFDAVGVVFKGSGFYRTDSRASANGDSGAHKSRDGESTTKANGSAGSESSGTQRSSANGSGSANGSSPDSAKTGKPATTTATPG